MGKTFLKRPVRSGIRTHASIRRPERSDSHACWEGFRLESGALDRSAILTSAVDLANQ